VETATLLGTCTTMAGRDTLVVLSGSLPPGVLPSLPQELCTSLAASGARLIVDTSGAGLLRLANQPGLHKPRLLRFDQQEAEELAGHTLASPADTAQLAENLVHRGVADAVMIARGAEGNIVADGSERLICIPAPVPVRSKVGAGDSFVAACTLSLSRGGSLSEALLYGTAAANAAVMTDATELCHAEDVSRLLPRCRVMSV
jgi:6-phosphofructokinase 2